MLLAGAAACFVLGVGATLLFLSRKSSPQTPPLNPSRRDVVGIDSQTEPPLASAHPPSVSTGQATSTNEATNDVLAEARQLMNAFLEEQLEIPPVTSMGGNKITRRETKTHIYYDVPIAGLKKEDLHIQVGDGMITVSGKIEREDLFSSFRKSFSIPEGVHAEQARILPEADSLVIEFPKRP